MGRLWEWWYDLARWQQRWGGLFSILLVAAYGSLWIQGVFMKGYPVLNGALAMVVVASLYLVQWHILFRNGAWKLIWIRGLVDREGLHMQGGDEI